MVGRSPLRAALDQGYQGHRLTGHPHAAVYITGQRRGVTDKIKRCLKRRAVVEPVIGRTKNDSLLGRNWLHGRTGDRCNTLLPAAGFNLRQVLCFLSRVPYFLRAFFSALLAVFHTLLPDPCHSLNL
jgi:IS5 family transposase